MHYIICNYIMSMISNTITIRNKHMNNASMLTTNNYVNT